MKDIEIISLYHKRQEQAIKETEIKYGSYCSKIAWNILNIKEDAEECVNDTYLTAWNKMPPEMPQSLKSFLGCIVRNLSIDRYRSNHSKKRYAGMEILLSELNECIPVSNPTEQIMEQQVLTELISSWLIALSPIDRALFIRRYWMGDSIAELAKEANIKPTQMTQKMYRLRMKLKKYLESEGVVI